MKTSVRELLNTNRISQQTGSPNFQGDYLHSSFIDSSLLSYLFLYHASQNSHIYFMIPMSLTIAIKPGYTHKYSALLTYYVDDWRTLRINKSPEPGKIKS